VRWSVEAPTFSSGTPGSRWCSACSRTARRGPTPVARLLPGIVLGSLAHATMFVLLASLLVSWGIARTYTLASLAALAVNGLALVVARGTGPPASPPPR
jgi:hypothetical protein